MVNLIMDLITYRDNQSEHSQSEHSISLSHFGPEGHLVIMRYYQLSDLCVNQSVSHYQISDLTNDRAKKVIIGLSL